MGLVKGGKVQPQGISPVIPILSNDVLQIRHQGSTRAKYGPDRSMYRNSPTGLSLILKVRRLRTHSFICFGSVPDPISAIRSRLFSSLSRLKNILEGLE